MFYRTLEGLLLKCLGPTEANRLLHEVHEGACGTHQWAHKMKWLIRRLGYYWPTMLEDSFKYYKGCQACQRFGKIQMVPASVMNPITKPWPFRGWGIDMIDKINPPSSKGHVIPRSEKEGTTSLYVCPGCSNHTYSNNMITRIHVQ
jgi:hypothetical protein